ncbi:MAG: cobyrinate a,c-diamide synthase [Gammaproteobacteria bacterium]|nr:cobyrinate a,c-diamide synthase [Gammaproteobacteria bacterium]NIN39620.1 cobyrinate a,c-diamide synthase [Gammaproteobacteria bacterium]NIO25177.1 cobyrinate a,c-diamide synthase [Gammaproteobacteria bacterium]NIO65806.1 cobyrinate a,c-diamide synthase [Gammaproteobacteria bacterium]NIP45756.1 cobyrinate a,c-diamide synthase [Gammaproteobacteria bacterium]
MAHLYISAAHKSSGKTVVATGLCAALRARGLGVQPFKKGPDYIDPMWLGRAAGRACRNLDFFTMACEEVVAACNRYGGAADISIIEGTKGLHDGVAVDGSDSNAALARLLASPVILVVDARGLTRGVAPLVDAQARFDPHVHTAGVILNRVGGARHEGKLRAAIEHYTDIPVLGAISDNKSLDIPEGHLGLLPANDHPRAARVIDAIAGAIRTQVDLEAVVRIAGEARWPAPQVPREDPNRIESTVRIGVARDAAFGFYYPEDLEGLRAAGAELAFFDTMNDASPPEVDALFIGGGFPERHMERLAANGPMRRAVRERIEAGMPVYAECGGLMYLSRSLSWQGRRADMVGVVEGDAVMHEKPRGRGYVKLRETGASPWPVMDGDNKARILNAHEFHYSDLENCAPNFDFAYEVVRGRGIDGRHDGVVVRNTLASFSHLRDVASHSWTRRFVAFVRARRH